MSKLEKALAALKKNKNVSEHSKVYLDPETATPVPAISTGSVVLDFLIGGNKLPSGEEQCPGIPRGRITEIYGAEGSGKCLTEGMYVSSEFGLLTVGELFRELGYDPCVTSKTEECETRLLNEYGEMEATSHLTWNGRRTIKRIHNKLGMCVEATDNHPLRVMSETGHIVWKNAGNIEEGDWIVVQRGGQVFGTCSVVSPEIARWIGYLVADGYLNTENRIAFSNSDPDIIEDYYALTRIVLGEGTDIKEYRKDGSKSISHHVNSKSARSLVCERYGLDYVTAEDKTVPLCIRKGTEAVQREFLRGYIDLECHFNPSPCVIEISSASYELVHQVQLMLNNFGIMASLSEKKVGEYPDKDYWRLYLRGSEALRYIEEVGFVSRERLRIASDIPDVVRNSNIDIIPNLAFLLRDLYSDISDTNREDSCLFSDYMTGKANPTYSRIERIISSTGDRGGITAQIINQYLSELLKRRYTFSQVTCVEEVEGVPTFDVCLPKTHSFWSNGFISHNTTIALETAVQCQQAGGTVCFLDYENAISPAYAQALGVDLSEDKFSMWTPITWEEGTEIIKTMISAGVDLIIVDSVSAMVPQAEMEKAASDPSAIGLLARCQSNFLPKIVQELRTNQTAMVYINQIRSRIKTSKYDPGPDETTSGGNALKFYASLRLKARKIKTEYVQVYNELTGESEKQPVCNIVRAQNIKNKISPHQGHSTDFVLRYGYGIDNIRSIIDIAINRKIISKAGAWLKYIDSSGEEISIQGKDSLRDWFEENVNELMALNNKVLSFAQPELTIVEEVEEDPNAAIEILEDEESGDFGNILHAAIAAGKITQSGPWFKFKDENDEDISLRGKDVALEYLMDHPELVRFLVG